MLRSWQEAKGRLSEAHVRALLTPTLHPRIPRVSIIRQLAVRQLWALLCWVDGAGHSLWPGGGRARGGLVEVVAAVLLPGHRMRTTIAGLSSS